jgi:hypothetical protein
LPGRPVPDYPHNRSLSRPIMGIIIEWVSEINPLTPPE